MHCINCGNILKENEKYCTNCGSKVIKSELTNIKLDRKTWSWKTFFVTSIFTTVITSSFWFFYYYGFVDKSSESANIIGHLIETVGRQQKAWEKSDQVIQTIGTAFSDECLYTEGCVNEASRQITSLKTEVEKERTEIDNLWSENVLGNDFENYIYSLSDSEKSKLLDTIRIYFPDESDKLDTSNKLL